MSDIDEEQRLRSRFRVSGPQLRAAFLVAEGEQYNIEIAKEVGVHLTTLSAWLKKPAFRNAVDHYTKLIEEEVGRIGIARKIKRVEAKNKRWMALRRVMDERGAYTDGAVENQPGWTTGTLIRELNFGRNGVTEKYITDSALLREMSNLEKEVAQELGQWVEKRDTAHSAQESFLEALRVFGKESDE